MKKTHLTLFSTFAFLAFFAPAPADPTEIDFDPQGANRGGNITGIPDSPLTIDLATFTGGELLNAEVGMNTDRSGVYATEGTFGSGETNPLLISFAVPLQAFSVLLLNGDDSMSYTVSDDLGESLTHLVPSAGSSGASIFSLPGVGLKAVRIASANADTWDFAIDNLSFTPTASIPEPESLSLVGVGVVLLFAIWLYRHRRLLQR